MPFLIFLLKLYNDFRPLVYVGMQIFTRFGVADFLAISETVMRNWLQLIEANYHASNSYHNSTHAADVLQSTSYFLDRARIKVSRPGFKVTARDE